MSERLRGLLHLRTLFIQRHAPFVLGVAALLAVAAAVFAVRHWGVDGSLGRGQTPSGTVPAPAGLVLTITAPDAGSADAEQARLVAALQARLGQFSAVHALEQQPYYRRHGLLGLDAATLAAHAAHLRATAPLLNAFVANPSLSGFADALARSAPARLATDDAQVRRLLDDLAASATAAAQGRDVPLAWHRHLPLSPDIPAARQRRIELTPVLDPARLFPASEALAAVRAATAAGTDARVQVQLSGPVLREDTAIRQAITGSLRAFAVAVLVSAVLMTAALRSLRLMVATALSVLFGLLLTIGFAGLVLGRISPFAVGFVVLNTGLGLGNALHLAMRYRALRQAGVVHGDATPQATADSGGAMLVMTIATAVALLFLASAPLAGAAELALLLAVGAIIHLLASLTLLPTLLAWLTPSLPPPPKPRAWMRRLLQMPYRHPRRLTQGACALLVLLPLLGLLRFGDAAVPPGESDPVELWLTLPDDAAAAALAARLRAVDGVGSVTSAGDFIPADQDRKRAVLTALAAPLHGLLNAPAGLDIQSRPEDAAALDALQEALAQAPAAAALHAALVQVQAAPDASAAIARLRQHWLAGLPPQLHRLQTTLTAQAIAARDLPEWWRARWHDADGRPRLRVQMRGSTDPAVIARFVAQVQALAPQAHGSARDFLEARRAAAAALRQALLLALCAVALLAVVQLRRAKTAAWALVPPLSGLVLALVVVAVSGIAISPANALALPLLLGTGVGLSLQLAQQAQRLPAQINLLQSGAGRAALFGMLVGTVYAAALLLSAYPDHFSLGVLLTSGSAATLLLAAALLPLRWQPGLAGAA